MFFQIRSIKSEVFGWLDHIQDSLEKGQMVGEGGSGQRGDAGNNNRDGSDDEEEAEYGFFEQKGVPYRVTLQKMKELI